MAGDSDRLAPVRVRREDAVTEPRRSARWTAHLLLGLPLLAAAAFAVWVILASVGLLLHTLGVIAVLILLGAAWTAMRR